MYAFDSDHVDVYYKVFGPCVCVQFVTTVVSHFARESSMGLSTLNIILNRFAIVVLYGYYRQQTSIGARLIYFLNALTMVLTYNSSQVPYRIVRRIELV
eukprot:04314_5